jgi:hypothetical protein
VEANDGGELDRLGGVDYRLAVVFDIDQELVDICSRPNAEYCFILVKFPFESLLSVQLSLNSP